jgi:hypothetical protein
MKRSITIALAALAFAWFFTLGASSAMADQKSPLTISITPVWFLGTTSDATSLPPAGTVPLNSPTIPRNTNDLRLNYGLTYTINKKSSLAYSHANFSFALGRLLTLAPGTSLDTGDIIDRIDTISYNYGFGHGLSGSAYYLSHQRSDVAGLCLNQIDCPNPVTGASQSNPASIDMNAYGVGFKYAFGPVSRYTGPLLTLNFDAQYVPRPSSNASAGLEGLPAYKGTQTLFPYGITMNIPIPNSAGIIPFIDYKREAVLWHAESTPEAFNVVDFGVVKIIRPNLTLAIADTHFNGCKCSDTVPPPDNVNFSDIITSLTYSFKP